MSFQPSLFNDDSAVPKKLLDDESQVIYFQNFLDSKQAGLFYEVFNQKIKWRQDKIRLYGKTLFVPRLQAWYADHGLSYTYSSIKLNPLPWFKELFDLKMRVENFCDESFNSVLLNYYRHGSDYVAWHSDDEPELGSEPIIASISLGGPRKFCLRKKEDKQKVSIILENGSLLLMKGQTQQLWQHQITRSKKELFPRINCTFRRIIKNGTDSFY